ncbi:chitinase-like protein 3 isoform X2 [Amblyomma americanum]
MVSPLVMGLMIGAAFVAGLHIGFVEGKRKSVKGWKNHQEMMAGGVKGAGVKGGGVKGDGIKSDENNNRETVDKPKHENSEDEMDKDGNWETLDGAAEDEDDDKLGQEERKRIYNRRDDDAPLVCFVRAAGFERNGTWRFKAGAVPADKCTHVVYSYLETDNKTGEFLFRTRGHKDDKDILRDLVNLKRENRKLKVLFSYGGGAHVNSLLSRLSSDKEEAFLVDTIFSLVKSLGLAGVNFHLDGPGPWTCNEKDVHKILHFIKKLRLKFGSKDWLITAQLPACRDPKCDHVSKKKFAQNFDYLFLMTFDYKLDDLSKTKLTSGLYFYEGDSRTSIETESCLGRWSDAGVPRYKLVPGIATYGRSFTLNDVMYNGVSAKLNEKHPLGYATNLTHTDGYMDYVEVKWFRKHWMGGVFVWSLEADDHSGDCVGEVFPMVEAAWKVLRGYRPLIAISQARYEVIQTPAQARTLKIIHFLMPGIIGFIKGMMSG